MITDCEAYHALGNDEKVNKAFAKMSAARKAAFAKMNVPYHVAQANGLDIPHRPLHTGETYAHPCTAVYENGTGEVRVHYCQGVREDFSDAFGSFGAVDEDDDETVWTTFDVSDETVMMKVVGDWSDRREVPLDEFARNYEPITLDGDTPQFGY